MALRDIVSTDYIWTTDGQRVIVALEDDGTVRVVFSEAVGQNVYANLSPADAHELGNKLRLAAKKAQS
jgi:hypothetical protein